MKPHDLATCPVCAPGVHSPAAKRGIARAKEQVEQAKKDGTWQA